MTQPSDVDQGPESTVENALRVYNAGDFVRAKGIFLKLYELSPDAPEVLVGLGMTNFSLGELSIAEGQLRRAVELNERHDVACRCLALILFKKGALEEAEAFATRATQLVPDSAQNIFTRGLVKNARGDTNQALACYKTALSLKPLYPEALLNLGTILMEQGQNDAAASLFIAATTIRPHDGEAYQKLHATLSRLGSLVEASVIRQHLAARAAPVREREVRENSSGELEHAANLQVEAAANPESRAGSKQAQVANELLEAKVLQCMDVPLVPNSVEELEELRGALAHNCEAMMEEEEVPGNPLESLKRLPRLLSSLLLHDRLMRTRLAAALSFKVPHLLNEPTRFAEWKQDSPFGRSTTALSPELLGKRDLLVRMAQAMGRTIRVGICSESFAEFSAGSLFVPYFRELPRELFEVYPFYGAADSKNVADSLAVPAGVAQRLAVDVREAALQISKARLDLLVFTDVATSTLTYLLALSRLAPIQCALWGDPETSGIPAMNYFLASQALVGGRAQSQFSESLVTLPMLTASCAPSEPSVEATRALFGLPETGTVFVCPLDGERIHPEMDYVFQRILQGERSHSLVVFEEQGSGSSVPLLSRFRRDMPDCVDQIFVRTVASTKQVLDIVEVSDVVLDCLHSGEPIVLLKSLSFGKPVITLPGKTLRSRLTAACYSQMNYSELVARSVEHYIQIALAVGRDKRYRSVVEMDLRNAYGRLAESFLDGVSELARFFVLATAKYHNSCV